jgi:hypothetical protein
MSPGGPPQELQKIAFLEGQWDVVMSVRNDPRAEWNDAPGTSSFKWILEKAVLEQVLETAMMGRPFLGRGYLAYNQFSGKWQHTWSDNVAAILSIYEGNFEDGRLSVIGKEVTRRSTFYVRVVWYNIADDKFDWVLETSRDAEKWTPMMKAVYTRKAG